MLSNREAVVVEAARAALYWFHNFTQGNALNRPNDAIFVGRQLRAALEAYAAIEVIADHDRPSTGSEPAASLADAPLPPTQSPIGSAGNPFQPDAVQQFGLVCTHDRHLWVEQGFGVRCICGKYAAAAPDFGPGT